MGDEVIFEKKRPNAFAQTDLATLLRERECDGVVVTGMKTQ